MLQDSLSIADGILVLSNMLLLDTEMPNDTGVPGIRV
jgi:hypothetical protein